MSAKISPEEVVRALLADHRFQFVDKAAFLRRGICPSCGRKELYVVKEHPWIVRCGRLNNCGWEEYTRELLPDLFGDYAKRYPPTEENRHATADAYLALDRGFDLSKIRGWYEQAMHQIPGTTIGIPTVRFYLDAHRTRWWERLIGRTGKDKGPKALFGGAKKNDGTLYAGDVWAPPGQTLNDGDRCYIVEGIFHAIALHHCGKKAVAAFSCSHFPAAFIESNKKRSIRWILALDSDKAGVAAAKKHHARLKEMGELASMCLLPQGKDWDDLYRAGRIDATFLADRIHQGRLALAKTVQEKAYVYYTRARRASFLIDFGNAYYSIVVGKGFEGALAEAAVAWQEAELEAKKQGKSQPPTTESEHTTDAIINVLNSPAGRDLFVQHCFIEQISNVLPTFLYMQRDEIMDEQRYVFKIAYANGEAPDIISLEGTAITGPDQFQKALVNNSRGGTFDGDAKQLKLLRDRWLNKRILTVTALPFVGYDKSTGAWIFQHAAWHKGKKIPLNDYGYFEVGRRGVKSVLNGVPIHTDGAFTPDWLDKYMHAFNWQGLATMAFWLGSLFAQQIRAMHKTFPFLELTGEPGAGKSTILEFLWKCVGREDYEGFDLLKSSHAGRRRAFSQVSNLPIVIIESDRDSGERDSKQKQFGFDELKPFYNGRSTGTLGVAKRSNDVDESPFMGSIVISQNAEVEGSEALLQRIVHCHADKQHHKTGTREIARWFERQSVAEVGGFLQVALSREEAILQHYLTAFDRIEAEYLQSGLRNERIIKNHAQVAACGHALQLLFPTMKPRLQEGLTSYLLERAKARENRMASDHPIVEQFWEIYDYISSERTSDTLNNLNHSPEPSQIALNLNQFREASQKSNQPLLDMPLLKKLLPHSRRHKLIGANKTIRSKLLDKPIKCWVFEK